MMTYLITGLIVVFLVEILVQGKSHLFNRGQVVESILVIAIWPVFVIMILAGQHKH